MLKPIQTFYRGFHFRSRLEARWAVFFDACQTQWRYEAEGFDLGGLAGWYLPDFFFPVSEVWVEVKPLQPHSQAVHKCLALAAQSQRRVVALWGDVWMDFSLCYFEPDGTVGVEHIADGDNPLPLARSLFFALIGADPQLILNAFHSARAARFESPRSSPLHLPVAS